MTIAELLNSAVTHYDKLDIACQATVLRDKLTKTNKPYLEATFSDGTGEVTLKCWEDSFAYSVLKEHGAGAFVAIMGPLTKGEFGWEGKFRLTVLDDADIEALLEGPSERRAFLGQRWHVLQHLVDSMADTALRTVTQLLLAKREKSFRRAAAARGNHHARRGGLVEHVTEMADSASALCLAYPFLNRSLLIAAIVFHDCGKMLENNYPERGFTMPHDFGAALCGHIAIGFQLARDLWLEAGLSPDDPRLLALRHCILSHHGELAWGSPVQPMCMEAQVVHYLDQISAKLEMFKAALQKPEIAPGLHERMHPLPVATFTVPPEQP